MTYCVEDRVGVVAAISACGSLCASAWGLVEVARARADARALVPEGWCEDAAPLGLAADPCSMWIESQRISAGVAGIHVAGALVAATLLVLLATRRARWAAFAVGGGLVLVLGLCIGGATIGTHRTLRIGLDAGLLLSEPTLVASVVASAATWATGTWALLSRARRAAP